MWKKNLEFIMMLLILLAAFFLTKVEIPVAKNQKNTGVVLVDVGHGGADPGKVGLQGVLEKDLNLQIGLKLKDSLEQVGYQVVMTRDCDMGLYEDGTSNKKVQDMQNRCKLIETTKPVCTVSIHQNSYTDPAVCGPQVFYYAHSKQGEELATVIQNCLNTDLAIERPRVQKENSTYYILKRSTSVTVLVECGFITNPVETSLLASPEYQQKVADAICRGVQEYLSGEV